MLKKLLAGLMISVYSSAAFAAEPLVHNGSEGVWLTRDEAAKVLVLKEKEALYDRQNDLIDHLTLELHTATVAISIGDDRFRISEDRANLYANLYKKEVEKPFWEHPAFIGGTAFIIGCAVATTIIVVVKKSE